KAYTSTPRHSHSATLIGNKLYILGGSSTTIANPNYDIFTPTNDLFYLDVSAAFNKTNIPWTDLFNVVDTPKQDAASVSTGGPNKDNIFLCGGAFENNSSGVPLVYTLDSIKNVWNTPTIQEIQPPRRRHSSPIIDVTGKMYIFGGSYNISTGNSSLTYDNRMDILDTINLIWSKGSQLQAPTPRDRFSATLLPSDIIVYIGGFDVTGTTTLREIYLYDAKNDAWETMITVRSIPDTLAMHTSVLGLNNDRLIIYGGLHSWQSPQVDHDLSVLDIRNKPYKWFIPNISGIIPPTPCDRKIYDRLNLQEKSMNPNVSILDIGNDFEYKW
ncbi:12854_t:CDS:2, partial [Racocetra persica]